MKGPLLKKINRQAAVDLKGWWLETLANLDASPFGKSFQDLVLRAAGEAMEMVMTQDDTMLYITSSARDPLLLTLVFPIADNGDVEWEIDLNKVLRDLLDDPEDQELTDLQNTRAALQALVSAFDVAIEANKAGSEQ